MWREMPNYVPPCVVSSDADLDPGAAFDRALTGEANDGEGDHVEQTGSDEEGGEKEDGDEDVRFPSFRVPYCQLPLTALHLRGLSRDGSGLLRQHPSAGPLALQPLNPQKPVPVNPLTRQVRLIQSPTANPTRRSSAPLPKEAVQVQSGIISTRSGSDRRRSRSGSQLSTTSCTRRKSRRWSSRPRSFMPRRRSERGAIKLLRPTARHKRDESRCLTSFL